MSRYLGVAENEFDIQTLPKCIYIRHLHNETCTYVCKYFFLSSHFYITVTFITGTGSYSEYHLICIFILFIDFGHYCNIIRIQTSDAVNWNQLKGKLAFANHDHSCYTLIASSIHLF